MKTYRCYYFKVRDTEENWNSDFAFPCSHPKIISTPFQSSPKLLFSVLPVPLTLFCFSLASVPRTSLPTVLLLLFPLFSLLLSTVFPEFLPYVTANLSPKALNQPLWKGILPWLLLPLEVPAGLRGHPGGSSRTLLQAVILHPPSGKGWACKTQSKRLCLCTWIKN